MTSTGTSTTAPPRIRVPAPVYLLAAVIVCLGTSEFMIAGILEPISADLGISIPQAGLLITGFAIGMIVGAPAMALHILAALAPNSSILMLSRVLSAVACGGFWAVAGVSPALIPGVLAAFGIGSFIGVVVGGRLADRNIFGNIIGSLAALTLSLFALWLVADNSWAASVNTSACNVGNAAGPALGGAVIALGWGFRVPVIVAIVLTLAAPAVVWVAIRLERSRPASDGLTPAAPCPDPAGSAAESSHREESAHPSDSSRCCRSENRNPTAEPPRRG